MVCDYVDIGRFVIGLSDDINILAPEFDEHITQIVDDMHKKCHKS